MIKERHIVKVANPEDVPAFLDIAVRKFEQSDFIKNIDLSEPVPLEIREKMRDVAMSAIDELNSAKVEE